MIRLALCLLLIASASSFAAPRAFAADKTHNGKVVSAADGQLEISDTDGDVETLAVDPKAKIVRNDKEVTLEDLKQGDVVTVKVQLKGGKTVAVSIVATAPE